MIADLAFAVLAPPPASAAPSATATAIGITAIAFIAFAVRARAVGTFTVIGCAFARRFVVAVMLIPVDAIHSLIVTTVVGGILAAHGLRAIGRGAFALLPTAAAPAAPAPPATAAF